VAFVRCAIDIRNVDVAAASKAGVLVTQASAGFVTSVSELVFGFMIDLARGITSHSIRYQADGLPAPDMGRELRGATLGVIGYGAIGREGVRLGRAFGMKVLIHDPYVTGIDQAPLDSLLSQSDFVVPLAVATLETENLMNAKTFGKMKQGACFINVSRGNLVDEAALAAALASGHIAGCALDVGRAPDQMPTPALAARPGTLATPHVAGLTRPAIEHQAMDTVAQAAEIVKGRVPKGAVNAQQWTRRPKK
jgi:D-3-phosphoglycerate dehydrogenase / 2-oxoglutarate reductase